MKTPKIKHQQNAASSSSSGEGYEARTSYPVQMTQDLIADIGARVSSITKTDESNTKVITNSSEPAKLGALATRQKDVIQLAPEVSDPTNTDTINNVRVNTDRFYEDRADKVAHEAMK